MKLKEEKMLRLLREIDTENWRDLVSLDELEADQFWNGHFQRSWKAHFQTILS